MIDLDDSVPRDSRILILGSSPSMPVYADEAFARCGKVFTTNAGIYECFYQRRDPDVYGIVEIETPRRFGRYYRGAKRRSGTKIFTIDLAIVNDPNLRFEADVVRNIVDANLDEAGNLELRADRYADVSPYVRGEYVGCCASGGYLLQYAMNEFAPREVWLVGMEGYRSTPADPQLDTFDGRFGHPEGEKRTRHIYGPMIAQVVDAWPETTFVLCGKITYRLAPRPNVRRYYQKPEPEPRVYATRIDTKETDDADAEELRAGDTPSP
jgi:hypothetical protein